MGFPLREEEKEWGIEDFPSMRVEDLPSIFFFQLLDLPHSLMRPSGSKSGFKYFSEDRERSMQLKVIRTTSVLEFNAGSKRDWLHAFKISPNFFQPVSSPTGTCSVRLLGSPLVLGHRKFGSLVSKKVILWIPSSSLNFYLPWMTYFTWTWEVSNGLRKFFVTSRIHKTTFTMLWCLVIKWHITRCTFKLVNNKTVPPGSRGRVDWADGLGNPLGFPAWVRILPTAVLSVQRPW